MRNILKVWARLAVLATFILGTMYVTLHQLMWQMSFDEPVSLTQDWANEIVKSGVQVNKIDLGNFIDPSITYQPFGIIYDQDGNIVASSASAPTNMTQPDGIFDDVDASSDSTAKYIWRPESGQQYSAVIRRAILSDESATYYILSAQNYAPTQMHQEQLFWLIFFGWIITLAGTFVTLNVHLVARHAVKKYKEYRANKKTAQA